MPITYGPGASDAVRTRLPGAADTVTAGEAARDADERFGGLVPLQRVDVLNEVYAEPMFVAMPSAPKILIVGVQLVVAPDSAPTLNCGCLCEFVWTGNGCRVRHIDGMSAGINPGTRYNFYFLGVG